MADVKIGDLARATFLDDTSLMVAEQMDQAVAVSGALFKAYAQDATKGYAETAAGSAVAAQSALAGVQEALNNLPAGDTLIINDLTTGGTSAALSAEMGKVLNADKLSKNGGSMAQGARLEFITSNNSGLDIQGRTDGSNITSYDDATNKNSNRAVLKFAPPGTRSHLEALRLAAVVDGITTWATILHTGHKPAGSYKGTGDATTQVIDTKGTGKGIFIYGGGLGAIVAPNGAVCWITANGTVTTLPNTEVAFANGVLTIATTSSYVNNATITYAYQVF